MCTSIVEIAAASGMAKSGDDWFAITDSVVAYDHARHALIEDAITIDFVNRGLPPAARAAVELTLDAAKALNAALARAIAAAEVEEAERSHAFERAAKADEPFLLDAHADAEVRPPATGIWALPPPPHKEPVFG